MPNGATSAASSSTAGPGSARRSAARARRRGARAGAPRPGRRPGAGTASSAAADRHPVRCSQSVSSVGSTRAIRMSASPKPMWNWIGSPSSTAVHEQSCRTSTGSSSRPPSPPARGGRGDLGRRRRRRVQVEPGPVRGDRLHPDRRAGPDASRRSRSAYRGRELPRLHARRRPAPRPRSPAGRRGGRVPPAIAASCSGVVRPSGAEAGVHAEPGRAGRGRGTGGSPRPPRARARRSR